MNATMWILLYLVACFIAGRRFREPAMRKYREPALTVFGALGLVFLAIIYGLWVLLIPAGLLMGLGGAWWLVGHHRVANHD